MMGNCSAHDDSDHHQFDIGNESDYVGTGKGCHLFHEIVNNYLTSILCIVGMIGNTISMVILRMDRQNRIASFLLQTLACVDNLLLGLSFITLNMVTKMKLSDSNLAIVNASGSLSEAASIWITVLLGINRYYAVCKPLKVGLLTLKSVKIQIAVVLLMCFVFNVPRFFPESLYLSIDSFNDTTSLTNISKHHLGKEIVNGKIMVYESLYTILVLILPLILLTCLNFKLYRCLRKLKKRLMNFSKEYKGSNEANITIVMVVVVVVMIVCHTPDRVLQTLRILRFYRETAVSIPDGAARFPCCPNVFSTTQYLTNLFIVFGSSVNFLIYYVLRKRFRRILKYKITKICMKSRRRTHNGSFNTTTLRPSVSLHHRSPVAM